MPRLGAARKTNDEFTFVGFPEVGSNQLQMDVRDGFVKAFRGAVRVR